ncbi:type II toxin-antitoxin system HipA family toxin [Roseateles chitinivorans]|uniref:type II toxin-antitoxin system HipA family toxin n=1 Tax=Roseateles chitinivorans TaxID=2917965 RepID=UPI003D674102
MIDKRIPLELPDSLWLWWLENPAAPRLVGELSMTRAVQGVSLTYGSDWLASGVALSEDLPLRSGEMLPVQKETAVGAVDDARPDRWGERVIRFLDKPKRLSVLDYLYYAGHERFGALGVSASADRYEPRRLGPLPELTEVAAIEELVQKILAGEPVDDAHRRLIAPGVTFGGARPKGLITIDGHQWVIKFSEPDEAFDMPLVEHATMTLCAHAGIHAAETLAVPLPRGNAVAVRRFDRAGPRRIHAISANVALKAMRVDLGYPELAQLLRRRGVVADGAGREQMRELFRRMVFNILIDNTDDHEKNHVLLSTEQGELSLSPAFDVLPSGQALGYQQLRVGADGHDSTIDNALSECLQFGLKKDVAVEEIRHVARAVAGWKSHFAQTGVSPRDIDLLAEQIDRAALTSQRKAYLD